jgi:hypothetical protein
MRGRSAPILLGATLLVITVLARPATTSAEERNSCGCYRSDTGTCYCDKAARCGCPGECEPRGCEEKRDRELQRQIDAETKKAQKATGKRATSEPEEVTRAAAEPEEAQAPAKRPPPPRETTAARRAGGPAHEMTPAQEKELLNLLDLYLSRHPGARPKTVEELRDQLSITH